MTTQTDIDGLAAWAREEAAGYDPIDAAFESPVAAKLREIANALAALRDERDELACGGFDTVLRDKDAQIAAAQADNAALRSAMKSIQGWSYPDADDTDDDRIFSLNEIHEKALPFEATDHPGQPLLDRLERVEKALEPFAFRVAERIGDDHLPDDYVINAAVPMHEVRAARAALKAKE